jgi:hypothetical protein
VSSVNTACQFLRAGSHTARHHCQMQLLLCGLCMVALEVVGSRSRHRSRRRPPVWRSTLQTKCVRRVEPPTIAMSWSIHAGGVQAAVCCRSCTPHHPHVGPLHVPLAGSSSIHSAGVPAGWPARRCVADQQQPHQAAAPCHLTNRPHLCRLAAETC